MPRVDLSALARCFPVLTRSGTRSIMVSLGRLNTLPATLKDAKPLPPAFQEVEVGRF